MPTVRFVAACAVAVLACSWPAFGQTGGEQGVVEAAALIGLDEVTVVYPAGPGEDREANLLAARQKAAFLERKHGVRSRVVADDEIGDAERRSDLFLLGWSNRLLGTEAAPRPFRHSESGLEFLGLREPDPDVDLIFATRSPYDPQKLLFFWSRLDPEYDRIFVLPVVGSSWALYRGMSIITQGMFLPGREWPPERDMLARGDHRTKIDAVRSAWVETAAGHYRIHAPASVSKEEVAEIASVREAALRRAAEPLGELPEDFRIDLYLYTDAEEKKLVTGMGDPVLSVPHRREMHLVARAARSSSFHEEVHMAARAVLGPCYLTSLYEGLAFWAEGAYRDTPLAVHAGLMLDADAFPPIDALLDEETGRALPPGVRYPAAGLLMGWLRETTSPSTLGAVYSMTEGSVARLAKVTGRPARSIEPAFEAWVRKQAAVVTKEIEFEKILSGIGDLLLDGDYDGIATALTEALELKPNDPQTLLSLASALIRSGRYGKAEKRLKQLLELPPEAADTGFRVFGHYQLARLLDVRGRRDEALDEYGRMLELPDVRGSHVLAREGIETPATAADFE